MVPVLQQHIQLWVQSKCYARRSISHSIVSRTLCGNTCGIPRESIQNHSPKSVAQIKGGCQGLQPLDGGVTFLSEVRPRWSCVRFARKDAARVDVGCCGQRAVTSGGRCCCRVVHGFSSTPTSPLWAYFDRPHAFSSRSARWRPPRDRSSFGG